MIKKLLNLKNNPAFINSLWIMFGRVFQMFISLVVSILTARYLGPSNYGLITYVASIVTIFSVIASLGLENVVINEFVKRKDDHNVILGSSLLIRFISGLLSIFAVCLLVFVLNQDNTLLLFIAFLSSLSLMFRAFDLIEYWYQYKLKSKNAVIVRSIAYIVMSLYKVALLIFGKSVIYFAASSLVESFISAILLYFIYKKEKNGKLQYDKSESISLIKNSYHFILSGLVVVLYSEFDKVIIGQYYNSESVGLYSTAVNVANIWTFVPLALIVSFRPIILGFKDNNDQRYLKFLKGLYALIFWMGILISLLIAFFSDEIIFILYGAPFVLSSAPLKIFIFSTVFSYLGSARSIWIVSENKNKYVKYYLFMGALISISLNLIFVKYYGIIGAAITSLITQIFTLFIAPLFFKETKEITKILFQAITFRF